MTTYDDINARHRARKEREAKAVDALFTAIALQSTTKQEQQALAWVSHHDFDVRQSAQSEQEQDLRAKLGELGIAIKIAHYTGDSSFPTEYTLIYGSIRAAGPTMDMAVMELVEHLLGLFGSQVLPK